MTKTAIAGSRELDKHDCVDVIEKVVRDHALTITEVVSGKARGADAAGETWALWNGVPIAEFPADWNRLGKAAGFIRNRQMAEYCDNAIILWDCESRGTLNMIQEMERVNKPYILRVLKR